MRPTRAVVHLKGVVMEAAPTKVIQYFNGEKQNLIPLFQRPYTWEKTHWQTFWNDLIAQYELGDEGNHFMGAIVSVPVRSIPVGVSKFLIIDGQQRLTTISLLLCALRDTLERDKKSQSDIDSVLRIQNVYLTNPHCSEKDDTFKFLPTQVDRTEYSLIINRLPPKKGSGGQVAKAYHFFMDNLKGVDSEEIQISAGKMLTTLVQCLQVVMINLDGKDDPYLIFESLNAKGEPLTQADLVRNYVLMRFKHSISSGGEQERVYSNYWKPLELALGSNLSEFLRHYIMKQGDDVTKTGIYIAIKNKLDLKKLTDEVESEIDTMQRFGDFYASFISPEKETKPSIRARLENIKEIRLTTSYPLMLCLFGAYETNVINEVELEKCLGLIETYAIRRSVCGVPNNALNRLFVQLAKGFHIADDKEKGYFQWLANQLSSLNANRRLPKDDEFADSFFREAQYGRDNTPFILHCFEKSFGHKEKVDTSSVTIEHIMPQTLSAEWQAQLGDCYEKIHSQFLHTFGNLSLTGYNGEMSNRPFPDKKTLLQDTHIELNRWVIEQDTWGANEIELRANSLLERANKLWGYPAV